MDKKFEITSGKVVLSDPCYELGTWCQGTIDNVKNGTWIAQVEKTDGSDGWGVRCGALLSINEEALKKDSSLMDVLTGNKSGNLEYLHFDGGVDSGQFGHFDYKHYRNDKSATDLEKYDFGDDYDREDGDVWYRACAKITLDDEQWGVLPHGVLSSSGYGDGSYPTYGVKDSDGQYVGFVTIFIGEDESEDDDYDDYDEDED